MAELREIVEFLDAELRISEISDYSGAMNGLQLESERPVERVVAAVDASLPVIEKAAAGGPGLLVVHHGMFWQGAQPLTGAFFRKVKIAMEAGLAIYSSHLPLDIHPEWGNNALLVKELGLVDVEPFFAYKGMMLGLKGRFAGARRELEVALERAVGGRVHVCPAGSERAGMVGVITGGAGSEVAKVAEEGVNTFISGEGPHWSFPLAEELGVNVLYGGHYATETFGVRKLAEVIGSKFDVPTAWVDHPTGL
ncbi:MAG: Nif3-like dinuclear metal center hexameric protein [Verrucomicrobiota bacterium JB025]|nr:Nif3-like dinuclear metal center hexameric protein [Verrucomicrobiota bacterium JB025]